MVRTLSLIGVKCRGSTIGIWIHGPIWPPEVPVTIWLTARSNTRIKQLEVGYQVSSPLTAGSDGRPMGTHGPIWNPSMGWFWVQLSDPWWVIGFLLQPNPSWVTHIGANKKNSRELCESSLTDHNYTCEALIYAYLCRIWGIDLYE